MSHRIPAFALLGAFLALSLPWALGQDEEPAPDVRIGGPVSTRPLLAGVARALQREKGLFVGFSTAVTNLEVLDAVAQGRIDVALLTKPLTYEERAQYPAANLVAVPVGMEAIAIGVSNDIWDAGIHSITSETMIGIYEQKITNWHEVGGPDEKILFFKFQEGHGVWEGFTEWLYGDVRKAPSRKCQTVTSNEDARDTLEFTPGSIAPIDALYVDGSRCHALDINLENRMIKPSVETVASRTYPVVRPLTAVVVGRPSLANRAVTEFLTGAEGQALVKKFGAFGLDAVPKPSPNPYY